MLIIGERINGMFKNVRAAIAEENKDVIVDLAHPSGEGRGPRARRQRGAGER